MSDAPKWIRQISNRTFVEAIDISLSFSTSYLPLYKSFFESNEIRFTSDLIDDPITTKIVVHYRFAKRDKIPSDIVAELKDQFSQYLFQQHGDVSPLGVHQD